MIKFKPATNLDDAIRDAYEVLFQASLEDARLSLSGGLDSTIIHDLIVRGDHKINKVFISMAVENPNNIAIAKKILPYYDDCIKAEPKKSYRDIVYDIGFPIKNKEFSDNAYKIRQSYLKLDTLVKFKTLMYSMTCIATSKLNVPPSEFNISDHTNYINKGVRPRYYKLITEIPIQNRCCRVLKKEPSKLTHDKPIIGILYSDSRARRSMIADNFNTVDKSAFYPLRSWSKDMVIEYAKKYNVEVSKTYTDRTLQGVDILASTGSGCLGCHYGNTVGHKKLSSTGDVVKTTKLEILELEFPKLYKNTMSMQHSSGITYGEAVTMAEESLKFVHFEESLVILDDLVNRLCIIMQDQGYDNIAVNFKTAMESIISTETAVYEKTKKGE